ncbi:MAG: apolipoprotein N-acyltransferase [Candidatus Omnitrophica bacterium]|nr:apolipoprotein N-acyltransferase [Candidatus Omnitrophota bacterium]
MKKYSFLLCIFSAILLMLPFFNGQLWLFSWMGFVPLFFLLENKTPAKAFFCSYFCGWIFFTSVLYWLIHVTLLGWIVLNIYLALYFGLFGLIINLSRKQKDWLLLFFVPSVWVCLEFIRGGFLTGFPWAFMGYSQYENLPVIQIADITGAYGVSFLLILANFTIYKLMRDKKSIRFFVAVIIIILFILGYGFFRLNQKFEGETLRISVVQGNIPQEEKWQEDLQSYILGKYLALTAEAVKDKPDIVIWPETSVPGYLEEEPLLFYNVSSLAKELKTKLLVGTVASEGPSIYNSATLVSQEGKIKKRYDKLHLVPFGEYIPFPKVFSFVSDIAPAPIGDFSFGKDYTVFSLDENKQIAFSVLICFEDVFPYLSRSFVKKGAGFLVNITNDAWFKKTVEPYQHLQSSVFRAIENRVWVVRAANTGVSCFVDPTGKVVARVQNKDTKEDIFVSGHKTQDITLENRPTFYLRFLDVFVFCCFIFSLGSIFIRKR